LIGTGKIQLLEIIHSSGSLRRRPRDEHVLQAGVAFG
jgi:hypothetical protein